MGFKQAYRRFKGKPIQVITKHCKNAVHGILKRKKERIEMNEIILSGRLVKDPEVRYTQTQKVVTLFSLAVSREVKNEQGNYDADFFNCVAWGKTAELMGNTLKKGARILLSGRVQIRNYESNGERKYITEVIVNKFEYLDKKEQPKGMGDMGMEVPFD